MSHVPGESWNRDAKVGGQWDDEKFPAVPDNINSAATRYRYNYDELTIEFDADARSANERIGLVEQIPHKWWVGTDGLPHFHWFQDQAALPNWVMEYRIYSNGGAVPAIWTAVAPDNLVFTYPGSGRILQISTFPAFDLSAMNISDFIDIRFSRDTANLLGVHTGADPVASVAHYKEFDIHMQFDSRGSNRVFTK